MKNVVRLLLLTALVITLLFAATSCDVLLGLMGQGGNGPAQCKHEYSKTTVEPTCTEQGYVLNTCKLCGAFSYSNYTKAKGHVESEWIIDREAGEDTSGEKHTECTVCHEVIKREGIAPHKHEWQSVSAVAPTCTTPGHNDYQYCSLCEKTTFVEILAIGHNYSAWTSLGNGTHSRVCANDSTHVDVEACYGGEAVGDQLPVCSVCGVEYAFAASLGNSSYGYYVLGEYQKGKAMQKLYKKMFEDCEEFALSTADLVKDEYDQFVIGSYDLDELSLTAEEAKSVWKIFCVDNPSYYWLSNVVATVGNEIHLTVDEAYAKYEDRAEYSAKIAEKIAECNLLITNDMSDLEKAMTIVSYIVGAMEYAYDENGQPEDDIWAHNLTGFAVYGYGVCESYSKTFMHLCLLNGVDVIIGYGYGGNEKHAWNYIFIDGDWYGADITWTDNSGDQVVFDYFGIADEAFHAEHNLHPSDSFGLEFSYVIPNVSDVSLELCELIENGVSRGIYTSVEDAFVAMVDPSKEYEIKLGYYSFFTGAPEYTLDITNLPVAKKITVTGVNVPTKEGYLDNNTVINLAGNIKLNSALEFKNVRLDGQGTIQINKNALTFSGDCVYVNVNVSGITEGCLVNVNTEDGTYFNNGIDAYRVVAEETKVIFGGNSHIIYIKGDQIYTSGNAQLNIENREK